jgi:hypothetical protein
LTQWEKAVSALAESDWGPWGIPTVLPAWPNVYNNIDQNSDPSAQSILLVKAEEKQARGLQLVLHWRTEMAVRLVQDEDRLQKQDVQGAAMPEK